MLYQSLTVVVGEASLCMAGGVQYLRQVAARVVGVADQQLVRAIRVEALDMADPVRPYVAIDQLGLDEIEGVAQAHQPS